MRKSIDYSKMESWMTPALIQEAADAIRKDSASVAEATADIGPTWWDLLAFFRTSFLEDQAFFEAGNTVSAFGDYVKDGGENIANMMEDCAQIVEQLERERESIITRADRLNSLPSTPTNDKFTSPGSATECTMDDWWEYEYFDIRADMRAACKKYDQAMQDLADAMKSLDDDGSQANPWLDAVLDWAIFGGTMVGIFIPPVAVATTVLEGARYYADEYRDRKRELLEEYPEMYDKEIESDATKTAVLNGSISVMEDKLASQLGDLAVGKIVEGIPLTKEQKAGLQEIIETGEGPIIDYIVGDTSPPPPTIDPERPRGQEPPSAITVEQQEAVEAAKETIKIKDYDGDGYTDPEFWPGSEEVQSYVVEPAEQVVVPDLLRQASDELTNIVLGTAYSDRFVAAGQAVIDSVFGSPTAVVQVPLGLQTPVVPEVLAPRPEFGPPAPVVIGPVYEPPVYVGDLKTGFYELNRE